MAKLYFPNSRNVLVNSPHYAQIIKEYNRQFADLRGRINDKKFWESVIHSFIPNYSLMSWYQFLRRWKDAAGLEGVSKVPLLPQKVDPIEATEEFRKNFLTNEQATQIGINIALNLGTLTLREIAENPDILKSLPPDKRIELLFKAMKAQDSRIHALGKVREDSREQAKFERAFKNAAFE